MENSLEVLKNLEDQENAIRESLESSGSETAKLSKAQKMQLAILKPAKKQFRKPMLR